MVKILKTIHQIWKDANLPKNFAVMADSWKELHPGWDFKLWTDEMNRELVKKHYPGFLQKYDSYPPRNPTY